MTRLLDAIEPEPTTRKGAGVRIQAAGALVLRYGLVLVIGWIGLMKFTGYEAWLGGISMYEKQMLEKWLKSVRPSLVVPQGAYAKEFYTIVKTAYIGS